MSLTKHLALITSTERLWPHDSVDSSGNAVLAFGLNLVTAIVPTPNTATPLAADDITLLKPWSWDPISDLVVLAQRGAGTFKPLASKITLFTLSVTDPQKKQMIAAIDSRVDAMHTASPGVDPDAPFLWDPVNPKADEAASYGLFRHLLGSTSTTPAPVPYALNLAVCFSVNIADVDADFVDSGKIATNTVLLVAPTFQVLLPVANKQIKVAPSKTTLPSQFPDNTSVMWLWPCDVTDSANNPVATPAVSAYTVEAQLTPPAPDLKKSLLDLTRYWVLNDNKNVNSTDWTTQLAGQISDVWNLPRLLLDAIPVLVAQSQLTQPERYWETILASMHDRANLGWIDSPDGTGLLRFALGRAAAAKGDPSGANPDPRGARPASWQALEDGWARSLRSRLRRHDLAMSLSDWQKALLNLLPDLRGTFPAGPTTPNSQDGFNFLERVLSTLSNNRFLKQLLIDGGGTSASPGFWPQAFLNDAQPSVNAQKTDEDFIENTVIDPTAATFADSGTLSLSDGATWALTLGDITVPSGTPWDGLAYSIVLNDRPDGTGPFPLRIAVTQAHAAGKPVLKFHLTDISASSLGDFVSPALPDPTPPYHVRVLIQRDTSSGAIGKKSAFAVTLQVSTTAVAQGTPPAWLTATGPAGSLVPGTALSAVSVAVSNDLAAQPTITFTPLSAVSARGASTTTVIADWDADASLDKAAYAWGLLGDAMASDLASALNSTGLDIRRRLALGNIGRAWQLLHGAMTGSAQEITDFTNAFISELSNAFSARFNQTGIYRDFGPPPDNKPTDAAMIAAIKAAITKYATGYANANLGPMPAEDDSSPSANSQALVLQLDHLAGFDDSDPVSNGATDDDPLRSVAGLGILMQQAAPGGASPSFDNKWHALNLGGLTAFDPASSDYVSVSGAELCVTPVRVPYRDGAKQAIVTYDNTPLATRSLLSRFADLKNIGEVQPATTDTSPVPAFRFEAVTTGNPWARLPALKYGQVYNILPFAIGNTGALPKELAGTHPAELRTDNNLTNIPAQVITDCQRTVAYRRRVGIGPPRLAAGVVFNQQTGQPRDKLVPAYPDGVVPLARELEFNSVTPTAPRARFFYDAAARAGTLSAGSLWTVTIPRVIVPGVSPVQSAAGVIAFGLEGIDATNAAVSLRVKVHREGTKLTVTPLVGPPGAEIVGTPTPITITVDATPIDVRLIRDSSSTGLQFGWLQSDSNSASWTDTPVKPPSSPSLPGPISSAAVVADLIPTDGGVTTPVASFAIPRFLNGTDPKTELPAPRNDPPLLLVAPENSQALAATVPSRVDLGIRLPATDLQTWDRWYAMDLWQNTSGATAAVRATVWAGVYRNAPGSQTADVSIDDPAVSGFFVELVPLLVEPLAGGPRAVETGALPRPSTPIPQATLPDVQTAPVALTLNVLASDSSGTSPLAGPRLSVLGQTVSINITEQEIWELRVYPMVLASFFAASTAPGAQRFHELFGSDVPAVTALSASQRLFAPWRVVIEGTTSSVVLPDPGASSGSVPPADRFFEAVEPDFTATTVTVTLAKEDSALDPFAPRRYRYVARVDLARQVWRWNGRPVDPFPFESAADSTLRDQFPTDSDTYKIPMVWDAEAFGSRSGMDLLQNSTGVHFADSIITLFREDLSNDLRALYYRFSARAISRYAPLYPLATPATQMFRLRPGLSPDDDPQGTAWRRLFVPCRVNPDSPLARPALKLLVPLTQAEAAAVPAPGLLGILDESSYRFGGIGETVEAEVMRVVYAKDSSSWPEFGPDPILRGKGFTDPASLTSPSTLPLSLQILGPVGHTFDLNADVPRFVASTLVIQAPDALSLDPTLAWYFAGVRFRRIIMAEAMLDYGKGVSPTIIPPGGSLAPVLLPYDIKNKVDHMIMLSDITAPVSRSDARLVVSLGDHTLAVSYTKTGQSRFGLFFDADSGAAVKPLFPATLAFPLPDGADPGADARPMVLDLRFILERDPPADPAAGPSKPPIWHASAAFRVRAFNRQALASAPTPGAWQTLQAFHWPEANLPQQLGATWSGAESLSLRGPLLTNAAVSPFTDPVWAQFLPDSNGLIPARVVADPGSFGVGWQPSSDGKQILLEFVALQTDGTFATDDWNLGPVQSGEGSKSLFMKQVLLTEPIVDAYGRAGQERYLGLYYSPLMPSDPHPTQFQPLHISPVLEAENELPENVGTVRVRVMELQANATTLLNKPLRGVFPTGEAAWSVLFGPPQPPDGAHAADATARIVRVSQPVDLQRKVGPV